MRLTHSVLFCAAFAGPAFAGSIDWGTSVHDSLHDAGGSPLTAAFRFQLGTFTPGFLPSLGNASDWQFHWKLIEEAEFNSAMQYAGENSIMAMEGTGLKWQPDATGDEGVPANPNLFYPGEQVYVWVFNNQIVTEGTEWALVTGAGTGPDREWQLSAAMGDPLALTREWRLSNADTAVAGGLRGVRGDGTFAATPSSAYTLQTALVIPVPEPAVGGFLTLAGLAASRRRRRFRG